MGSCRCILGLTGISMDVAVSQPASSSARWSKTRSRQLSNRDTEQSVYLSTPRRAINAHCVGAGSSNPEPGAMVLSWDVRAFRMAAKPRASFLTKRSTLKALRLLNEAGLPSRYGLVGRWRHMLTNVLRRAGVDECDIALVLGHELDSGIQRCDCKYWLPEEIRFSRRKIPTRS